MIHCNLSNNTLSLSRTSLSLSHSYTNKLDEPPLLIADSPLLLPWPLSRCSLVTVVPSPRHPGTMGRKAGKLYINPKKFGSLQKPCMKETITFLNCLALNQNNDDKCVRQKELLTACMDAQIFNCFMINFVMVELF